MHAIRIRGMLVAALAAAALALCALATPAAAMATETVGIVSGGLVYDDVYGVVADHALMAKKDGTIDVVDSSGKVTFSTTPSENLKIDQHSFGVGNGAFIVSSATANSYGLYKNDGTVLLEATCSEILEDDNNYYIAVSGSDIILYSISEGKITDTETTGFSSIAYLTRFTRSDATGYIIARGYFPDGTYGAERYTYNYNQKSAKITSLAYSSKSSSSSYSTSSEEAVTLQSATVAPGVAAGYLPDGTALFVDGDGNIVNESNSPIKLGDYTLAQPQLTAELLDHTYGEAVDHNGYTSCESVQRGTSDAYYAKDSAGNYGAVSSTGEVVIPFEFECIEDLGIADESLILVKKGGLWYFYDTAEKATTQDMYRLYNPNSGEHFYTASTVEKNNLVSVGWNYEGIGWTAPVSSNTPVYRMYNPNPSPKTGSGEHHYTTSSAERDSLIAAGWKYEGIGWYSDDAKTTPLYRLYNPNEFNNNHHYTTSKSERDYLLGIGWNDEDIAWYGVK